jgi:hypothetical protein
MAAVLAVASPRSWIDSASKFCTNAQANPCSGIDQSQSIDKSESISQNDADQDQDAEQDQDTEQEESFECEFNNNGHLVFNEP